MEEDRMKRIRGSSLMPIRVRPMFAALLSTLFVCFVAFGQTVNYTTGSIAGKVSDDAGAGVPGVTVTTTNLDTGQTLTTFTDKNGEQDLTPLAPAHSKGP